ncbi:hypothetical protein ACFE04_024982 [Oxalis oulophora]
MSRKRDNSYFFSRNAPISKRRRPHPPHQFPATATDSQQGVSVKPSPPPAVVVIGLSPNCSVLDLKSRFEIYGPISRTRILPNRVGSIYFRSKDAAEAAIAASLDPSFGITLDSNKVQVLWATDPLAQWRQGVDDVRKDNATSSKLVRAGTPLSRHGRGRGGNNNNNRLASAIVINPNTTSDDAQDGGGGGGDDDPKFDAPFKGRKIVAYDDIL